ncbi:MAG: hypothetical protein ACI4ED_02435 [Suilimivivens sp.]
MLNRLLSIIYILFYKRTVTAGELAQKSSDSAYWGWQERCIIVRSFRSKYKTVIKVRQAYL